MHVYIYMNLTKYEITNLMTVRVILYRVLRTYCVIYREKIDQITLQKLESGVSVAVKPVGFS